MLNRNGKAIYGAPNETMFIFLIKKQINICYCYTLHKCKGLRLFVYLSISKIYGYTT